MKSKIDFDMEATLTVPRGKQLKSIRVTVEIEPAGAGVLIYGYQADGSIAHIEVHGTTTNLDLPFVRPQIYVKYLSGVTNLRVFTQGWL